MPKLSIIMPVYNVEKYIDEAVQSILCQTFTDYELFIIDDASDDKTLSHVMRYDDKRIKLVKNIKNIGKSNSIRNVLPILEGEYIGFMDGDDYCDKTKFEKQMKIMEQQKEIAVLGCGFNKIDGKDKEIFKYIPPVKHNDISNYSSFSNYRNGPMFYLTDATIVCRREVFTSCSFPENVRLAEYFYFYLLSYRKYNFSNIPECLYTYRRVGKTIGIKTGIKVLSVKLNMILKNETAIKPIVKSIMISVSRFILLFLISIYYSFRKIIVK
jgi:glycosyltransferase involved in cell wall biosynthesis